MTSHHLLYNIASQLHETGHSANLPICFMSYTVGVRKHFPNRALQESALLEKSI